MNYTYVPKGVCSHQMDFELNGSIVEKLTVTGGCKGNLAGISKLVEGMEIDEVILRLKGVTCGTNTTSCPDQIADALVEYRETINKQ